MSKLYANDFVYQVDDARARVPDRARALHAGGAAARPAVLETQAREMRSNPEYVSERSWWVIIKDPEQEWEFILSLWALCIMGAKWHGSVRERRLLDSRPGAGGAGRAHPARGRARVRAPGAGAARGGAAAAAAAHRARGARPLPRDAQHPGRLDHRARGVRGGVRPPRLGAGDDPLHRLGDPVDRLHRHGARDRRRAHAGPPRGAGRHLGRHRGARRRLQLHLRRAPAEPAADVRAAPAAAQARSGRCSTPRATSTSACSRTCRPEAAVARALGLDVGDGGVLGVGEDGSIFGPSPGVALVEPERVRLRRGGAAREPPQAAAARERLLDAPRRRAARPAVSARAARGRPRPRPPREPVARGEGPHERGAAGRSGRLRRAPARPARRRRAGARAARVGRVDSALAAASAGFSGERLLHVELGQRRARGDADPPGRGARARARRLRSSAGAATRCWTRRCAARPRPS